MLLVIVLAVVSFGSYYVWNNHHKKAPALASQQSSASSQNPIATAPAQKYLTIKEWGVRIPYSGSDTLSYSYGDNSNTSDIGTVEVISKNLADQYGCTTFGAGTIFRAIGSDVDPTDPTGMTMEQKAQANPGDYKKVGDYYYTFGHDQAACSNEALADSPGADASLAANNFTRSLIPSIQAAP